jgi:predicted GH43/DUF377 family glycosyl hydrolase
VTRKFYLIFLFLLTLNPYCTALIDLEEKTQDFILDVKQIHVSRYPHIFNASIVQLPEGLLMSFRHIPNPLLCNNSEIGLVWLDQDFNAISKPQLLDIRNGPTALRAEDARLISIGNTLYMIYTDYLDRKETRFKRKVFIAEVDYKGPVFALKNQECLEVFEKCPKNKLEKNWVPFDYNGSLTLAYSLLPHRILTPLPGTSICQTIASSEGSINWPWGELRGGTPALKVGDQYLSFFHTVKTTATLQSNGKNIRHYFMGAYTFSLDPPFHITQISPEPIIGKGFYTGRSYIPYWGPLQVIFPCGFIYNDSYIWVTYGRQDHENWVVKLDRKKLFESLVPVPTTQAKIY